MSHGRRTTKMKNNVWQTILKVIIAVASAVLGALGATATQALG